MSLSKPQKNLIKALEPYIPSSETIDHLLRYLGTWSGSDKFFMIIQYSIKLIVPFFNLRARLQYKAGLRASPASASSQTLSKFASIISDARMLWRMWGLLPIIQWLRSIERNPPLTRSLLHIERLQAYSMLLYYPFEHIYYLASHALIPTSHTLPSLTSSLTKSPSRSHLNLDTTTLSLYSSRFWALYVFLQFLHLRQDRLVLHQRQRQLKKSKATLTEAEQKEIRDRWDAYYSELVVNLGYAPLTLHWSLPNGLFKNDIWVGLFGLVAGIASFRTGWKATALPPPQEEALDITPVVSSIEQGYDADS